MREKNVSQVSGYKRIHEVVYLAIVRTVVSLCKPRWFGIRNFAEFSRNPGMND
jgi:hypothetical protein